MEGQFKTNNEKHDQEFVHSINAKENVSPTRDTSSEHLPNHVISS
jgi:hypothetical protein